MEILSKDITSGCPKELFYPNDLALVLGNTSEPERETKSMARCIEIKRVVRKC